MADNDARKAPREDRQDDCLHCVLMTALEEWFKRHGKRSGADVIIDVELSVRKLTECAVEIVNLLPQRSQRRRAMRFAHDAIDANAKSQATGKLVEVEIPPEH